MISIVIPAYNEGQAIGKCILEIQNLAVPELEILVVDDGSTDETAEVASQAGAKVLSHPYNIGNGAAVKTGIRQAKGEVIVIMDGDGQHDPKDIGRLLEHIGRFQMVVGARTPSSHAGAHRRVANAIYNYFASFVADFEIKDLTSGFRAIRASDAKRFCDMLPNGFSSPTTLTLAFLRSGRSLQYVPITAKNRIGKSKIKIFTDGFEFLLIILKIAITFSPLRVFLPVCSFLFFLGIGRYIYTYMVFREFTNMSHLLINSSVIVFMLGLVAEQISQLRLERGDNLFEPSDQSVYEKIARLPRELNLSPRD